MERLTTLFLDEQLKTPIALTAGVGPLGYQSLNSQVINVADASLMAIKGITWKKYVGNPEPRVIKLDHGMINAIGLDNGGFAEFFQKTLPKIKHLANTKVIVNINGFSINDYVTLAKKLNEIEMIKFVEVNISCPNIKNQNLLFSSDLKLTEKLIRAVRKVLTKKKMIVKLPVTPNIQKLAIICQKSGADAISLINSIPATKINITNKKPELGFKTGGLSGAMIKPIALWAVYQVYQVVEIPIIGIGGISSVEDALEFFLAGASVISIGSSLFSNPNLVTEIKDGLIAYCHKHNLKNIKEIVGQAHE